MVKVKEDLTGRVFGRLTVLQQVEDYIISSGRHYAQWLCQCECGKTVIVTGHNLKSGDTQSCGCIAIENLIARSKKYNTYDLSGEYGIGWTSNTNREFYFDLKNFELIKDYCWCEKKSHGTSTLVAYDAQNRHNVKMHQLLGYKNYDHIDKNELNNREINLRQCTHQQNTFNRSVYSTNTSGTTGVYWSRCAQKWEAKIMVNGKNVYLGLFIKKDDAIKARLKAEVQYFGDFAPQKHLFEQYGIISQNDCEVK